MAVSAGAARHRAQRTIKAMLWQSFLAGVVLFQPFHALLVASIVGSASSAAFFISLTAVLTAILEVPSGVLADLWGRRTTIIIGSGFLVAAHLVLYVAAAWMAPDLQADVATPAAAAVATVGRDGAGGGGVDGGSGAVFAEGWGGVGSSWAPWVLLLLRALMTACAEALLSGTDDALLYDVILEEAQLVAAAAEDDEGASDSSSSNNNNNNNTKAPVDVDDAFKEVASSKAMMWPLGAATASLLSGVLLGSSSGRSIVRATVLLSALPAVAAAVCACAMHEAEPIGRHRHADGGISSSTDGVGAAEAADAAAAPAASQSSPRHWLAHARRAVDVLTRTPELRVLAVSSVLTVSFADSVHLISPLFFAAKGVPVAWLGGISTGMCVFGLFFCVLCLCILAGQVGFWVVSFFALPLNR